MFKYFLEIGEDGSTSSIAINTDRVFCAIDGETPNTTILRLESGAWFTVDGSLLENVPRLNSKE